MFNMVNLILILLLVVLCAAAAYFAFKLLRGGGCCGNREAEKKVRVADKDPKHYPYEVHIGIAGMSCKHCKQRVENALNSENGVWAEVDLSSNSALVRMKTRIPEETLRRDIVREGYSVTSIR